MSKTLVAYTPSSEGENYPPPYINISRDGDTETVTITVRSNPVGEGDDRTCGPLASFRMSDAEWQALRAQIAAEG